MKTKEKTTPMQWLWRHTKPKLYVVALEVVFNVFNAGSAVLFALLVRDCIDHATSAAAGASLEPLIRSATYLASLALLQLILRFLCRYTEERLTASLEVSYRAALFSDILKKDYGRVAAYHSGDLLNRLFSDIAAIADAAAGILPTIAATVTRLVCAVGVMAFLEWRFTLIFIGAGVLIFGISRIFRGTLKRLHKETQEADGNTRAFMQESLSSLLVLKVFDAEKLTGKRADALQRKHFLLRLKKKTIGILANIGFTFIFKAGYIGALVWCALSITGQVPGMPVMTYGTLMAILQLVNQIQMPFGSLSGILPRYYGMIASIERVLEIEEIPDEATETHAFATREAFYRSFEAIRFEDVSFSYERENVLEKASFTIDKGDFCVITGLSGIGKSTLLKLLLGVYHPNAGQILLQTDEGAMAPSKSVRGLFAYVPQGNLLFSGTIRENIGFIKEDATDEEILDAARIALVTDFLPELPAGLDTRIGEKGFGLSEGQVQRVAIARAVLSGAPILLLDESTSALDEDTEKRMLQELTRLSDKTCIIVSHKKAAFDICNKELVLRDKGAFNREISHGTQ